MNAVNFPTGNFGVPYIGGMPALWGGNVYFADPGNITGRASGGPGSLDNPFSTLVAAYNACVTGKNDTVILLGDGSTTASERLATSFDWAKNATHLIGVTAPTMVGQRARITGPAAGGSFSPLMTISGNGCIFANFSLFDDYTVDPICVELTGQRNYFANVHFGGLGAATGADDAAGCSLRINGGDENTFENCYIGLDTIARSTTNSEIELIGGATRNIFKKCLIVAFCDNAGHLFVKIDGSGDIDRFVLFDQCQFYNAVESTSTAMTQAMNVHNTCGGMVMIKDSRLIGATDWCEADNGNVYIDGTAATGGSDGIMLAVTR